MHCAFVLKSQAWWIGLNHCRIRGAVGKASQLLLKWKGAVGAPQACGTKRKYEGMFICRSVGVLMRERRARLKRRKRINEGLSCRSDALDMTGSRRIRTFTVAGCLPSEWQPNPSGHIHTPTHSAHKHTRKHTPSYTELLSSDSEVTASQCIINGLLKSAQIIHPWPERISL